MQAQEKLHIYDPSEDATTQLNFAIQKAALAGKHVFVQVGGNWCPWCIRFHRFVHENQSIDSLMQVHYEVCLLNYSKENKNEQLLKKYGFPQRFGFPVFLILNGKGELLHIKDSGLLEEAQGYDTRKVTAFLKNWSPPALDPVNYP